MLTDKHYDLVVVGAGVIGLACAYEATERGMSVAVVERNARCVGASIRNFGFVTVTGQRSGEHWHRARLSSETWLKVAQQANIDVIHRGLYVVAQRSQALAVLQSFMSTDMGEDCRWLSESERHSRLPFLQQASGVMFSPHECRVESRQAIAQMAFWLEEKRGVDFFWKTAVTDIELPKIHTSSGAITGTYCVACPGHDLYSLFPELQREADIQMSTLQMLRVDPGQPIKLPGAVMSDLSLVRYDGYTALPESSALADRIALEQPQHLAQGVHLIVVQSADGSLVVGDSHVYGEAEDPFAQQATDELIMQSFHDVLNLPAARITERWMGTYASAQEVVHHVNPQPGLAIGIVTGGTGASTCFGFAKELIDAVTGESHVRPLSSFIH